MGNIHLRCQIEDLKSEVTCNIIDADRSYNLFLRRPWIHANWIVPSTLHQYFRYMEDDVVVQMIFTKIQSFKRVENYFTDFLLNQEDNEPMKKSLSDDINSGNQADSESEEDTPATFSMEPIIAYLDDPNCNDPAKNESEWVLNENVIFDYSLCLEMYLNLSILVSYTCLYLSQK